jgi:hypothetical protein
MQNIAEGTVLVVAADSSDAERYWLCRAVAASLIANGAFTHKGNEIANGQSYAEVELYKYVKTTEGRERQYKSESGTVKIPCSAFVYEQGIEFERSTGESPTQHHFLSELMHSRICANDELQFDSEDEDENDNTECEAPAVGGRVS